MNIGMKQSQRLTSTVIHLVLAVVPFIMVIPFVWMVLTAFKTISESTSVNPFVIFPSSWKWDHFVTVICCFSGNLFRGLPPPGGSCKGSSLCIWFPHTHTSTQ